MNTNVLLLVGILLFWRSAYPCRTLARLRCGNEILTRLMHAKSEGEKARVQVEITGMVAARTPGAHTPLAAHALRTDSDAALPDRARAPHAAHYLPTEEASCLTPQDIAPVPLSTECDLPQGAETLENSRPLEHRAGEGKNTT